MMIIIMIIIIVQYHLIKLPASFQAISKFEFVEAGATF